MQAQSTSHGPSAAQGLGFDLATALTQVVDRGASDLHLKAGNRPLVRLEGRLDWLDAEIAPLSPWHTEEILHQLLPESRIKEFEASNELDFAYTAPGLGRFRVNAYRQRGSIALVLRVVPSSIRTIEELGLPDVVRRMAEEDHGIVLVTGTTGSGKSTTMAAMIAHVNRTMRKHIVTIEDPIEFVHQDAISSVDQREVGTDTASFETALRQVMRQDPDIIFIGEMRDEESVRVALSAADTGHLVLATLHTADAAESISRILDVLPGSEQQQARVLLAGTLKGIVSQRLVRCPDGKSRTAITEILVMTGRVHDRIIDADKTAELADVIAEGEYYGMHSFDQSLCEHVTAGTLALEDALTHATRPHDLKLLIASGGSLHTTMDDLPTTVGP
jgi:twitching motility protein PilT